MNPSNDTVFRSDRWQPALEKFAGSAHMTIKLFDASACEVVGPIHPTPLFQLFDEKGYDPGLFAECARRCLAQAEERPAVLVSQLHGLTVIGAALTLEGEIVGAAVGGYVFADFSQVSEIQRLARQGGVAFPLLWDVARIQKPVSQSRLIVQGELLQVFGDTLLSEHHRTRQYEQAAAIVDSSSDAIVGEDLNGVVTTWNRGAERVFGYSAQEIIGRPISILMPAGQVDEQPSLLVRLRRGDAIENHETVCRSKDGAVLNVSWNVSPIFGSSGQIIGVSQIGRDITERKQAEQELRRANEDLKQFAFAASHDLQEPLRMITSYSQLLLKGYRGQLNTEASMCVDFIGKGTKQMRELLSDLLSFTEVGAANGPPEHELVNLNLILQRVTHSLKAAIDESAALVTCEDLPEVEGEPTHFVQLFQNLITNAIKYRGESSPRVHVTAELVNGEWLFAVADNGIGIDPEYHQKVFGVFKRLHGKAISGTGIGLAICQRVIERYGGRIWVESQVDHGATFYFTLRARS
jgi:PAS domain S-box-containing protein